MVVQKGFSIGHVGDHCLSCVQFNVSNPATGAQKCLEIDDERKL